MTVQKLVIVIRSLDNSEVIERWQFNVQCDKTNSDNNVSVHRCHSSSVVWLPLVFLCFMFGNWMS